MGPSLYRSGMQVLARSLQIFGLTIVPFALVYYFTYQGEASESQLMFVELSILTFGAACFWIGNLLLKGSSS